MPNYKKKKHHSQHKHGHQAKSTKKDSENDDDTLQSGCSKLYEIKTSEMMGRYLVATKPIKPGDVLIEESPLVVGPPTEYGPVCLGCLKKVDFSQSQYKCAGCHWPICSQGCGKLNQDHGHTNFECNFLREKNVVQFIEKYGDNDLKVAYEIIFPLRCLLLKLHDKSKWDQLMEMEAHNDIRKNITWLWTRNQTRIVNRIHNEWKIDDFTEEEIHTVCGIIEVNCFEVGHEGAKGRALYPTSFLMAHDCSSNSTHTDNPENFSMQIRAMRDIKKGESITVNYGYILMGTLKRRERLNMGKFFWCACQRCSDPTEFGTYCSALKCSSCSNGILLSTNPLDQQAEWKCLKCSHTIEAKHISSMLDKLFDQLDSIDPHDVRGQEMFIERYGNILGSNHYLILSAKYDLCQLYGRAEDFLVDSLSEDLLKHKEDYCRDVLKVVKVLEPGLSRVKGIVMYELHVPLLLLAGQRLRKGQINKSEFMKCLKEVVSLLEESSKILKMEPGQKEQEMVHGAEMALMTLKLQKLL